MAEQWTRVIEYPGLRREEFAACVFNNRIFISGGLDNNGALSSDVWASDDGMVWEQMASGAYSFAPQREGHNMLVHDNQLWVVGGYDGNYLNDVWRSPDGRNWYEVTSPTSSFIARDDGCVWSLGDRMYIAGGDNGADVDDCWMTYDGTLWRQIVANYSQLRRTHTRPVVFNGRMWLICGHNLTAGADQQTVMWSQDGLNWYVGGATNGLPVLSNYAACVFDNKIVVTGGDSDGVANDNLYYSMDGINWKVGMRGMGLTSVAGLAYTITNHEMVALKNPNRLFLLFGDWSLATLSPDIWMSYGNWRDPK